MSCICMHAFGNNVCLWPMSLARYAHSTYVLAGLGWSSMPSANVSCKMCTCHARCMQSLADASCRWSISAYDACRLWTMVSCHVWRRKTVMCKLKTMLVSYVQRHLPLCVGQMQCSQTMFQGFWAVFARHAWYRLTIMCRQKEMHIGNTLCWLLVYVGQGQYGQSKPKNDWAMCTRLGRYGMSTNNVRWAMCTGHDQCGRSTINVASTMGLVIVRYCFPKEYRPWMILIVISQHNVTQSMLTLNNLCVKSLTNASFCWLMSLRWFSPATHNAHCHLPITIVLSIDFLGK